MTDDQIVELRKQCFGGRFGAPATGNWGDTLKFARALETAVLAENRPLKIFTSFWKRLRRKP